MEIVYSEKWRYSRRDKTGLPRESDRIYPKLYQCVSVMIRFVKPLMLSDSHRNYSRDFIRMYSLNVPMPIPKVSCAAHLIIESKILSLLSDNSMISFRFSVRSVAVISC